MFTDTDECLTTKCLNGGTCKNLPGSFMCECTAAWTGQFCENGNWTQEFELLGLNIFNAWTYLTFKSIFHKPLIYFILIVKSCLNCSWNQPVLSNDSEVSCWRIQQYTLMGFETHDWPIISQMCYPLRITSPLTINYPNKLCTMSHDFGISDISVLHNLFVHYLTSDMKISNCK